MFKIILFISGGLLPVLGISLLPSMIYAYLNEREDYANSLLFLLLSSLLISYLIRKYISPSRQLNTIQGFGSVGLSWILLSLFGTLPYIFSDINLSYIDILFETISGLTTTGSSIITNVESVDKSLLIWRSTTQWLGGMGVIVLTITVLPLIGAGGINLFKAESPGPSADRLTPKFKDTAKLLWVVYISLTVIETVLLYISGLTLFDSFNHSLTTLSTGGFSTFNSSVSNFSQQSKLIINVFMYLAGISFILLLRTFKSRSLKEFYKSTEFKFYTSIVLMSSALFFAKTYSISNGIVNQ